MLGNDQNWKLHISFYFPSPIIPAFHCSIIPRLGARTIAQNEATCVVYGMPQEAVKNGAVDRVEALDDIAGAVMEEVASMGK